jgi:murein DD-endopeptidase MepM/ murein hydrolase activator NlpD
MSSFTNTSSYSFSKLPSKQTELLDKAIITEMNSYAYMFTEHNIKSYHLPIGLPLDISGFHRISGYYGIRKHHPILKVRRMHKGIDFVGNIGTPIYPTAKGTVKEVRRSISYGRLIIVDHGKGVTTLYAHLNKTNVKVGDAVDVTDQIAELGSTGWSTGPHLHYEIRVNDRAINPLELLFVKSTNFDEQMILQSMLNQTTLKKWKRQSKNYEAVL